MNAVAFSCVDRLSVEILWAGTTVRAGQDMS